MKSDIVLIDNRGNGFAQALEQTQKAAAFRGISHQDSTRLQLIAEEMLSLARSVTGEMQASFWMMCRWRNLLSALLLSSSMSPTDSR